VNQEKIKAQFGRLLLRPVWKWNGPIVEEVDR